MMHIYFSGIGGAGIGPLSLVAKQAGYEVSGSDIADSAYINYLRGKGITNISIGQTREQIAAVHAKNPIDWFVYSSALPKTNPDHPELTFCQQTGIRTSKRDEFLNQILKDKSLKLIAVAGTHGKSTTAAMLVWLAQGLGIKASWSIGAKISFGDIGHYEPGSQYFIYEADEYDRNFLSFHPHISLITGLDWDHPDVYPIRQSYMDAFGEFVGQSERTVLWRPDAQMLALEQSDKHLILDDRDPEINKKIILAGQVNRLDGWLVAKTLAQLPSFPLEKNLEIINKFPGLSRRFEKIAEGIYSDYAHTPPKIRGALQMAEEVGGQNVVVVYEGLHNLRQHFIKEDLATLFDNVKQLYVVPSYLARENKEQELLTPDKLVNLLSNLSKQHAKAAQLDDGLRSTIKSHAAAGDLVLCLTAGGADSLDEWLRKEFSS